LAEQQRRIIRTWDEAGLVASVASRRDSFHRSRERQRAKDTPISYHRVTDDNYSDNRGAIVRSPRFVRYETLDSRRLARGGDADNSLADAGRSDNNLSMGTSYTRVGEACAFVKFQTALLVHALLGRATPCFDVSCNAEIISFS